jgi:branched-chain amino acid transport system substrate-binding protein
MGGGNMTHHGYDRRTVLKCIAAATSLPLAGPAPAKSAEPIRIGGTLALTGPLAQTAMLHKISAQIFVDDINKRGGLLGRKVEYVLYDDQSKGDVARSLYEKLITVDKVDLLMGPYATQGILAGMAVAQRYGKLFIQSSLAQANLATYERHFPTSHTGPHPEITNPKIMLDAWMQGKTSIKSIAIATSKFPAALFLAVGMRREAEARGIKVVLYLEYDFPSRDLNPIAARVKDANADFLWVGAIGLEGNQLIEAMKKIEYKPPRQLYSFPASGPMAAAPDAEGATAPSFYEEHAPMTSWKGSEVLIPAFHERATAAGLPYTRVDSHVAAEFAAWQLIEAAATATGGIDDKAMADWLKKSTVDTIMGPLRFNEEFNYGEDRTMIRQVQNGRWQVIWPEKYREPGTALIAP